MREKIQGFRRRAPRSYNCRQEQGVNLAHMPLMSRPLSAEDGMRMWLAPAVRHPMDEGRGMGRKLPRRDKQQAHCRSPASVSSRAKVVCVPPPVGVPYHHRAGPQRRSFGPSPNPKCGVILGVLERQHAGRWKELHRDGVGGRCCSGEKAWSTAMMAYRDGRPSTSRSVSARHDNGVISGHGAPTGDRFRAPTPRTRPSRRGGRHAATPLSETNSRSGRRDPRWE
jgi:hypothetical protein